MTIKKEVEQLVRDLDDLWTRKMELEEKIQLEFLSTIDFVVTAKGDYEKLGDFFKSFYVNL